MMELRFQGASIRGMLGVLPPRVVPFEEDAQNYEFSLARSLKLKQVMGYGQRRVADPGLCISDLAEFGIRELFRDGHLKREEIHALVVVSQSPDHLIPPTSCILHGRLELSVDCFCLDINQGCAGFVVGLMQAMQLLHQPAIQTVVLVNAEVLSQRVSPKDRNSHPLVGDAAAITVVDRTECDRIILGSIRVDGTRHEALMIPAGGFRLPSSPETAVLHQAGEGNLRAQDHLSMDGTAVFNFVQSDVPPMILELLERASLTAADVDYFLFHQPNRFMLQKLADRLGIPHERMPNSLVEVCGNSSGATIPLVTTQALGSAMTKQAHKVCFAGFGVGLTWGALLMEIDPMAFCHLAEYKAPSQK